LYGLLQKSLQSEWSQDCIFGPKEQELVEVVQDAKTQQESKWCYRAIWIKLMRKYQTNQLRVPLSENKDLPKRERN
jgi:hypothetical protein